MGSFDSCLSLKTLIFEFDLAMNRITTMIYKGKSYVVQENDNHGVLSSFLGLMEVGPTHQICPIP